MCLSYLNAVVLLPEAGHFHLERAALGDPLGQLHIKKLVLLTGSPQQSTGFWDNSVAAKLKLSLLSLRIIFSGLTQVTGGYGLQSYLVSVMSSYARAASARQLQPRDPCGIDRFGCHDVDLMALSMSVGFNRFDIWGVGRFYLCIRNVHPSEGT